VLLLGALLGVVPAEAAAAPPSVGTVIGWGDNDDGEARPPAGLTGVTAIAAGWLHSMALKSDGTVAAWGYDGSGWVSVPVGLTGVTAIAAGSVHSLALRSDGSVIGWGDPSMGRRLRRPD
jgi:alpha-tubulin suppressor-like RCC1 family protein